MAGDSRALAMFYGDLSGDRAVEFKAALLTLKRLFDRVYAQDNLITINRNMSFMFDRKFVEAFRQNSNTTQEKSLLWRLHTLAWAARHCLNVPGDFAECGVWRGFSFAVLTDYLDWGSVPKAMYLYDTFEGIPEAYNTERRSNAVYQSDPELYEKVVTHFSKLPNVKVIKGIVPDSFADACPEKISLLHIDMNSSKAEIAALDHLFDRVSPGGIIVFDDFGWGGYHSQMFAEIEWTAQRGHSIMELPTGQGVLLKH